MNNKNKIFQKNFKYYCCFCSMGKKENLYSRELISYYMSLGVEKFIFGDNNLLNTEKLSDLLQDYINNNTIDIIEIYENPIDQAKFYGILYEKYKNKCKWLTFFDFDEYLVVHNEKGENILLKEYLSNPIYDKCEAIEFNWLIYGDNEFVYYDNRSTIKRFTTPNYNINENRFVKSIIRGNLTKPVFLPNQTYHRPYKEIKLCNSLGEITNYPSFIRHPIYKFAYLKHFITRTAEEFAEKIKRGRTGNRHRNIEKKIYLFFQYNNFTEEKLKVFEKKLNRSFGKYHFKK